MTSLFSTRRRAEEFDAAVSTGPPAHRTRVGEEPRELHPDLAPLVSLATALRDTPEVAPRDEFVADLRTRLLLAADEALVAGDRLALPTRRSPRERRLVAAASVAVVLAGTTGVAAAAQEALPGDALYPVKRSLEWAEAGLSTSEAGKGKDLLHQAAGRLGEVEGLLATGSGTALPQVPGTLEDFTGSAQEGSDLLLGSYRDGGDPSDVVAVREFTAESIVALQQLARTAPPDAQDELVTAALTLRDIDQAAVSLCSSCASDLPDLQVPGIFLAASEVESRLLGLEPGELDNSHPVVVPAQPGEADGEPGAEAGPGGTPAGPAPAVPDPATEPPKLLPEKSPGPGKGAADEAAKGAKKKVDDTVDEVTEPLPDPVKTLLPDPAELPDPGGLLP